MESFMSLWNWNVGSGLLGISLVGGGGCGAG